MIKLVGITACILVLVRLSGSVDHPPLGLQRRN